MGWREELQAEHRARKAAQLWRQRPFLESPQGREIVVGGQRLLNFCSNDYLGLTQHPAIISAAVSATREYGAGSGASHLVCGHSPLHQQLEERIAQWVGAEAAIVFSTGYMANLAVPQTFLRAGDLLLQDRLNHASLIDAGLASDATMKRYPHRDFAAAAKKLQRFRVAQQNSASNEDVTTTPRAMISTDGVFSMDGDIAPVIELAGLCKTHDGILLVDDAHGLGTLGARGAGLLEHVGIGPSNHVLMIGTLGKSAGSFGAFVAGDRLMIETLVQHARPYIYTTALPPAVVAATAAAIEVIEHDGERRERLAANIIQFQETVASKIGANLQVVPQSAPSILPTSDAAATWQLLPSTTAIQPIVIGEPGTTLAVSQQLRDEGIFLMAIRPPTVPAGSARLRITITSEHRPSDIARLVEALGRAAARELQHKQPNEERQP